MSVPPGDPPKAPKPPEPAGCERAATIAVIFMFLFLLAVLGTCFMHGR
jgi:hypothetical protein